VKADVVWDPSDQPPGYEATMVCLSIPIGEFRLFIEDLLANLRTQLGNDRQGVPGARPQLFSSAALLLTFVETDINQRHILFDASGQRTKVAGILQEVDDLARSLKERGALPPEDTTGWGRDWSIFNPVFLSRSANLSPV
jgi:hypothetical protein